MRAGDTHTFVENPGVPATGNPRIPGYHKFFSVRSPIEEMLYPTPRIFDAEREYIFPFSFIVPESLPITMCKHTCASDAVREEHKQISPSLGDRTQACDGRRLLDDMAPQMSKVKYWIQARLTVRSFNGEKEIELNESRQKIRLIPAVEEHPPVNVEDNPQNDNVLRRERMVKKGTFRGMLGCVTAEVAQPTSLQLPPPGSLDEAPPQTRALVVMRYDPGPENLPPPRVGAVAAKLRATTYFSTVEMSDFPEKSQQSYGSKHGRYIETVKLSARCLGERQWTCHDACDSLPRASTDSERAIPPTGDIPRASTGYLGGVFHTTTVLVPIHLPKKRAYVPTFHACIVARVYHLEIAVSVISPDASILSSKVRLRVPVQISARARAPRPAEQLVTEDEVDAIFSPRSSMMLPLDGAGAAGPSTCLAQADSGDDEEEDEEDGRGDGTTRRASLGDLLTRGATESPRRASSGDILRRTAAGSSSHDSRAPPPGYDFTFQGPRYA